MSLCVIAFHFAHEQYREELARRIGQAAQLMSAVDGCLGVECWREPETGAVVAVGRWETEEARSRSFAAVERMRLDLEHEHRLSRPPQVFTLDSGE